VDASIPGGPCVGVNTHSRGTVSVGSLWELLPPSAARLPPRVVHFLYHVAAGGWCSLEERCRGSPLCARARYSHHHDWQCGCSLSICRLPSLAPFVNTTYHDARSELQFTASSTPCCAIVLVSHDASPCYVYRYAAGPHLSICDQLHCLALVIAGRV
jgi:hypothetical protein